MFGLSGFDGLAWALTAGAYLSALMAAGAALFLVAFPTLSLCERTFVRHSAVAAAAVAFVLALLQLPMQAGFLGGGTLEAARDAMLVRLVWEGPLGTAVALRMLGLVAIGALLLRAAAARWIAVAGALLVAVSFTQVGHSLSEPRWLLAGLLSVHVSAAAFWIGALAPLHGIAGAAERVRAGALLERFGRLAAWVVGALVLAGVAMAAWLLGGLGPLFTEPYGQLLLAKVALVATLIALAAYNKLRLSPAVARGSAAAAARLRASIRWEMFLVLAIVAATAALTTFTSPGGS